MDAIQIIEIVAVVLGLGNVYFLTQQKLIAWPLGLIMVSLYAYIFYQTNLLSDFILHLVYIVLNIYGWWYWIYGNAHQKLLAITELTLGQRWSFTLLIVLGSAIWGYFMSKHTQADFAYADAFTTVASLVAQYLLAKKKLENWIIWVMVNVVAMQIYLLKGLFPTSGLYLIFLVLAVYGFREWKISFRSEMKVK